MTLKPATITFYARMGNSRVLNEITTYNTDLEVVPITDENRQPGDADNATERYVNVDLVAILRDVAVELEGRR